jgi:oligoribonuclease NrnB/cAMP/cGMP phosphodiesterase (DHH superfamily)
VNPLCIFHGNCFDGAGAAWVVRRAFVGHVECWPGVYGEAPPDVTGRDVILVDFSYKADVLRALVDRARSLLVLDHHESARDDLAFLPALTRSCREPFRWDQYVAGKAAAVFDMDRSGAGIAWDFFNPGEPRPLLIDYIEDRDLWRFKLPNSRLVAAALSSYPMDFDVWDRLFGEWSLTQFIQDGKTLERKHWQDIRATLAITTRRMVIGGHDVPVANVPVTIVSDAVGELAKGERFAAGYYDGPKGRGFSLRSSPEGLNVSEIAVKYGGGGHKNAAGFLMPRNWEGDTQERILG